MREEVLKWNTATEEEKENIMNAVFSEINNKNNLNVVLEYNMPVGYESANGITDILQNKVFINLREAKSDTSILKYT